jgi:transposase
LLLDQILGAGYTTYAINPKQAERYRDRHTPAGSKNDRLDAVVHADAVRTDRERLRPLHRDSKLAEELRLRDRARTRKVEERTRLGNQLSQTLSRYFPALLALERDMQDPFLLDLLEAYPEPQAARGGRLPRLEWILCGHRVRAIAPEDLAKRLRAPALSCPAYVSEACRDEALDLAAQIRLLNEQVAAADARLDELLERHPDREILRSLPGLGNRLSVRVVAELGDSRDRYADRSSLEAFAGTAPVTRRSGKRGIISITMRKGCNRTLQAALFTMARCSLAKSRWARAYYDSVRGRGRGLRHATAVRSLSNKWAKILWAVLTTRETHDEGRHVARLLHHGVPWAKTLNREVAA